MRPSDLRDLGVDLAWHEAVALVLEIPERFVPTAFAAVPSLAALTLSRQGALRELAVPHIEGPPVPRLAGCVSALAGEGEPEPGLVPPVRRPPAPAGELRADAAGSAVGTLDLVVGADGRVEHVRLVAPTDQYRARMLVSVANAWVFEPARKDERPVRCRMRVRVAL